MQKLKDTLIIIGCGIWIVLMAIVVILAFLAKLGFRWNIRL